MSDAPEGASDASEGASEGASDAPETSAEPPERRPPSDRRATFGDGSRVDLFGALAIIAGTAGLVLGPTLAARLSAHPSAAECDALLARYVEMKQRAVTEKVDPKSVATALDAARGRAGPGFAACTTEVTLEEADCARKANNADELERCLR